MKPQPSKASNGNRRHPLQHLNVNPNPTTTTRTTSSTTTTSTRKRGDCLRFRLSHSSSSSTTTTTTGTGNSKTKKPNLPSNSKGKCSFSNKKLLSDKDVTPLLNKIPTSSVQGKGNDSRTPPVQASVSPELPLQSTSTTTTPACYGAGHLFSCVSDKRKCRPKGLLAVHAEKPQPSSPSPSVPLPVEASMHWLFSPSPTSDILSPSSPSHFSHTQLPHHSASISKDDSLGSGNVIRTPLSHSTASPKKDQSDSRLCSLVEALRISGLSPNATQLTGYKDEDRDSIALSFQFDSPTTSCSWVHQLPDDHQASWNSCSTVGNESQMRMSWREGLMSQTDEMDEFDSCRFLSDDDEEAIGCSNDVFHLSDGADPTSDHILTESDCCRAKISDGEMGVESGKCQEPPQLSYSCAESITTDGGSLFASADSDWALHYKEPKSENNDFADMALEINHGVSQTILAFAITIFAVAICQTST